ncbi:MAG: hypothetical protein R3B70_33560 [Polyangiaceae bacterium]
MENGYFRIGRFGGAPVRIHWSAPLGAFFFGGFRFAPAAWGAFILIILIHELGHAALVRRFRLEVSRVDVHGIGGVCCWHGYPTPMQRALIAWGGVFGQAVLLAIAFPLLFVLPPTTPDWAMDIVHACTRTNLYLMAINLLPVPGFDGAEAWKIFGKAGLPAWWRSRKFRKSHKQAPKKGFGAGLGSQGVYKPFDPNDILEKTPTDHKRPPPHMLN